jgi:hypothetical protein
MKLYMLFRNDITNFWNHTLSCRKNRVFSFMFFSILFRVISKFACVVLTLHHVVSEPVLTLHHVVSEPHRVASKIHTLWKQSHTIFFQLFLFHDMCSRNCYLWFRVCVMLFRNDTVLLRHSTMSFRKWCVVFPKYTCHLEKLWCSSNKIHTYSYLQ